MRIALAAVLLSLSTPALAETVVIERIVPPGATITYSESGQNVRTQSVPPGRVRVTIEYDGEQKVPRRTQRRME